MGPLQNCTIRKELTMHHPGSVLLLLLCLSMPALLGCNRNPLDRQAVSGRVTLDGKPLDQGTIQFCPKVAQGGIFAGGLVVDGTYEIPLAKGLPPGAYTVRISAAIPGTFAPVQGPPGPSMSRPLMERIPPKYNSNSELTAEVKSEGGNVFDFTLSGQSGS